MRSAQPRVRRWTRLEYEALIHTGVFAPDERLELIEGELVVREPQATPHATAIRLADAALRAVLPRGWMLQIQLPLALGDDSQPEPDLAVVKGTPRDFRRAHPSGAALVIEIAETSLEFDRNVKGRIYARAGVLDYWIVNLVDRALEVYRRPLLSRHGGRYASRQRLAPHEVVSPVELPGSRIRVSDLLP